MFQIVLFQTVFFKVYPAYASSERCEFIQQEISWNSLGFSPNTDKLLQGHLQCCPVKHIFNGFFDKVDNSGWIFFAYLGGKNKKSDQNEQKFWEFGVAAFIF